MTAATPPPPHDGEVQIMCTCGARGRNPHPWEPGEWCPIRRPDESAPSEPPAADSPTPGTCHVCGEPIGGEHGTPAMAHDCEHPGCAFGPGHSVSYHLVDGQRVPTAPSPVDTTEPPAETQGGYTTELGGQTFTQAQWEAVRTYIEGTPAETLPDAASWSPVEPQHDDEASESSRDLARQLLNGVLTVHEMARTIDVALAARPSADTETLRDVLRLIAGPAPHCSASTTERHACRQPGSGRTRGARYGADAWCDQCIARAALDAR